MLSNMLFAATDFTMQQTPATDLTSIAGILAAISAIFMGFMVVALILGILFYLYSSWALYTIAKKLGYKNAWFAWIPILQIVLYPILADKEWPWVFILLVPIANIVFTVIWMWKIFEKRKYPGWLMLIPWAGMLIPIIGFLITAIAGAVIIGLVAWKDR